MIEPTSDGEAGDGKGGGAAHPWRRRERPLRMERRLVFPDYEALRDFLDRAGELSEQTGIYPNLSFGRTYVNLSLFAEEGETAFSADAESFVERIDDFVRSI
jgi:4a-hydroxytetrahydrobiopterin dehydratase